MPSEPSWKALPPAPVWMIIDVEAVGLHGEAFAVGASVVDDVGNELDHAHFHCDPRLAAGRPDDHAWVEKNCPGIHPHTHKEPGGVCEAFWEFWLKWKEKGAVMVGDCNWPVEARFLANCVDRDREPRVWDGPYPLHDVATMALAAGLPPLYTWPRHHFHEPAHNPLNDARHSARLWTAARLRLSEIKTCAQKSPGYFNLFSWVSQGAPVINAVGISRLNFIADGLEQTIVNKEAS